MGRIAAWSLFAALAFNQPAHAESLSNGAVDPPLRRTGVERLFISVTASTPGRITFDDFPVNTKITDQYQALGVIFTSGYIELDGFPSPLYLSGENESYPSPYGNGRNAGSIVAHFVAPTSFVEADPIYLDGAGTPTGTKMTLRVFNSNGVLLASVSGSTRLRAEGTAIKKAVFSFHNPSQIDDIAGIDNLSFEANAGVTIVSPSDQSVHALSKASYTETPPIAFSATSSDQTTPIGWSLDLSYETSGGVGPFQGSEVSFFRRPGSPRNHTFKGEGGRLDIRASQDASGASATAFIVGNSKGIPNIDLAVHLTDLYADDHSGISGYTPELLCQIAVKESNLRQFTNRRLYGVVNRWPTENFTTSTVKGGEYIGLMQVPVSMKTAFDWMENSRVGLNVLNGKISAVLRYQDQQMKTIKRLPRMTGQQVEDSALALYGGFGNRNPDTCERMQGVLRYYVPKGRVWVENGAVDCISTQGNSARQYVEGIRSERAKRLCQTE